MIRSQPIRIAIVIGYTVRECYSQVRGKERRVSFIRFYEILRIAVMKWVRTV
jgi:hypothetical protein